MNMILSYPISTSEYILLIFDYEMLVVTTNQKQKFVQSQFDTIVFTKEVRRPATVNIMGWISKDGFLESFLVAGEGHALDAGTWYLPTNELWDPATLHEWIHRPDTGLQRAVGMDAPNQKGELCRLNSPDHLPETVMPDLNQNCGLM
jgi:hypothetical protein